MLLNLLWLVPKLILDNFAMILVVATNVINKGSVLVI